MGRRKLAKNVEIRPWLSRKVDCKEGRFIQVGNSLVLAKELHEISAGARWLYLCLAMESGGNRDFIFTHGAAKKYGVPTSSFDRQVKELKEHGFIELVEDENMAQFAPNKYRFSFAWKGLSAKSAPPNGEG